MAILELLGITKQPAGSRRGISGIDIGLIIFAVGCVSVFSGSWLISTAIIGVGVVVFIVGAVRAKRRAGNDPA
ncbi:hypothetical protein ACT3TS_12865 [Specibacter sp. AOP5-B1-6]|uniref:hypothetical protein n=1 Tax=Specibacter sp. AOP5-B1-6 TaxID=3457653 RepID=UPI003FB7860E